MSRCTVLVTGAGTTTAVSLLKGLRNQQELEVRTIAVDMNPDCAGRYFGDAFYVVRGVRDPTFVETLLDICRRESVGLLVPIVDYEFLPISQAVGCFTGFDCRVAISFGIPARDRVRTGRWISS